VERRDLLRTLGAAAAYSLLPRTAEAAWATVAATPFAPLRALSAEQSALVGVIADTLLPRTDTPGATDVGIEAFVDVIVAEHYADADRAAFLAGLDAIEAQARSIAGAPFADLAQESRATVIDFLERPGDRRTDPARAYWRLKGLVIHGYFTSERVMKEVLKVEIMPGRFDGAAPMPVRTGRSHE
jgi:hypothetical protein